MGMSSKGHESANALSSSGDADDLSGALAVLLKNFVRARQTSVTEEHIQVILSARRGREKLFGYNLFSDYAWDVVLELYAAKFSNGTRSSNELARSIGVPESVIKRWMKVLVDAELIAPQSDERGAEPVKFGLTNDGAAKIDKLTRQYVSALLAV